MSCCTATWGGYRTAHCSAARSVMVELAVWDGDPSILAERYAHLHECPIDRRGVPGELLSDLISAHPTRVKPGRTRPPADVRVFENMIVKGQGTKVLWSVVGPVQVDVVNLMLSSHPAVEDAMLVGFDVLLRSDAPTESDVSMRRDVSARLVRRDLFTRRQVSNSGRISSISARPTVLPLDSANNFDATADTRFSDGRMSRHKFILQVNALCCRTFTTPGNFDRHRPGECRHPADVGLVVLRETYGTPVWGQPGDTEEAR